MQERARIVPAEVLYRTRRDNPHHMVYTHRSEESVLVTDGNQLDRTFIQPESLEALQRSGYSFIHVGILQFRVQILHRAEEGTMAMVVFRDNRWQGDQAIFATMEIDLTKGYLMVYVIPDTMMTVGDFARNIGISVQTRGYSNWQNGEANLLITRGMTGRLSNTPNVAFAYQVDGAVDYLISHGVKAIAGKKYDPSRLRGQQWVMRPPRLDITPMQPQTAETRTLIDGSVSIRFGDYQASTSRPPRYNEEDEETASTEEEIIAVWMIGPEEQPDDTDRVKVWEESCSGNGRFYRYYTAPPQHVGEIIATGWGSDDDSDELELEVQQFLETLEHEDDADMHPEHQEFLDGLTDGLTTWSIDSYTEGGGEEQLIATFGEMEYPTLRRIVEENRNQAQDEGPSPSLKRDQQVYSHSEVVDYNPPADIAMTPVGYPPATNLEIPAQPQYDGARPRGPFKGSKYNEWWQLPSAQTNTGAIFVMPRQIGLFHDVFDRWESITKNYVTMQGITDATEKVEFIENLLGEMEKQTWIQWRMMYPTEFETIITRAEGREGTQNILSQIRRVFSLEDPATGTTHIQDQAYRDLERLTCNNVKDLVQYLNDFGRLAAKTGRMFLNTELSDKLWLKMPGDIGQRMKMAFNAKFPGNQIGVFPRILYAYQFMEQECKNAAFQRSLKNLAFCKDIPLPGYYAESSKSRYGARKSTTYKGKAHSTHARIEKKKHLVRNRRCKCYLCGDEGHFARECPNERRNVRRVAVFENLALPDDYEIVSVQDGEEESDAIYSLSENENGVDLEPVVGAATEETCFMFREEDNSYWVGKGGYLAYKRVTKAQYECKHTWAHNKEVEAQWINCSFCKRPTNRKCRAHCPKCRLTTCEMCADPFCEINVVREPEIYKPYDPHGLIQQQRDYIAWCEGEMSRLRREVEFYKKKEEDRLAKDLEKERARQEKIDAEREASSSKGKEVRTIAAAAGESEQKVKEEKPVRENNNLYNMTVEVDIPGVPKFSLRAILDTGATVCCVDSKALPKEAIEDNTFEVHFRGINSKQSVNKKMKYGRMSVGGHNFRIPYTYTFPMDLGGKKQFILGCNFIRSMYGGVRLEGNTVTFYKNITAIDTKTVAVLEELEEEDLQLYNLAVLPQKGGEAFERKNRRLIEELKNQAIFQRKMDQCFKGTEKFIAVYIDDILVFSKNEEEHAGHVRKMLEIVKSNGLILSPTKMCLAQRSVEFLGAIITGGKLQLQPHIIKKVVQFDKPSLETTKGLRGFLGLLNYARAYIPNLGRLLSPLYAKTSPTGERRFSKEDWKLDSNIQTEVQKLPDLNLPPEECCIIIETDGCIDGWGAVCKWKKKRADSRNTEMVCAYGSGKFENPKSTIDAEITAVIKALESFKIYYLDKQCLVIRTDCQAIVSFFNKSCNHKPSRVRWVSLVDYITGMGLEVKFEHIDGKENQLADVLSRLISMFIFSGEQERCQALAGDVDNGLRELQECPQSIREEMKSQLINYLTRNIHISWPMMDSCNRKGCRWKEEGAYHLTYQTPLQNSALTSKMRLPREPSLLSLINSYKLMSITVNRL
ncbi:ORFIII-like polyprotein [Melia azedarach]|uniref:ORFIII-like polyprotein n=1 Tax=Melia azedarach TaxID=155640 RepID=A0ACC1XUT6_MELAZ|nr:ORFIII-like polyprotein [Melia azedarach]